MEQVTESHCLFWWNWGQPRCRMIDSYPNILLCSTRQDTKPHQIGIDYSSWAQPSCQLVDGIFMIYDRRSPIDCTLFSLVQIKWTAPGVCVRVCGCDQMIYLICDGIVRRAQDKEMCRRWATIGSASALHFRLALLHANVRVLWDHRAMFLVSMEISSTCMQCVPCTPTIYMDTQATINNCVQAANK